MALVKPPPPPAVEEPPPVEPVEAETPKKKPPPPKKVVEPPPEPTPPPPNVEAPPEPSDEPPPPPTFGVTMNSVVGKGGGMRVRVGNTLMKEREKEFTEPGAVQPYRAPKVEAYVPLSEVTKMASPRGECRGPYPQEAKDLGIEGTVKLLVEIAADGSVASVQVLKSLGYGLDEVALRALNACRFNPAYRGSEPVAVKVPYSYRFELDRAR